MTVQDEAFGAIGAQSVESRDGCAGMSSTGSAVTGGATSARPTRSRRRREVGNPAVLVESEDISRVDPGAGLLYLEIHLLKSSYSCLRAADSRAEARLLASIAREGQRAPIVVVPTPSGDREVIDGFRRIRALRQLRVETVTAIEWPTSVVDALLELRLTQGRSSGATPVEEGLLIATLVDTHGLSMADLSVRFGRSRTWVHNRLALVRQLPEAVTRRVLAGELSGYVACKVVVPFARANSEWVEPFCQCIIENGLTSRQTEALYQGLVRIPDPVTRRQILDRPSRILNPEGGLTSSRRGKNAPDPLDAVERLEGWCRHTRGLAAVLKKVLANGASEDTMDRLAVVWRENESAAQAFLHLLHDLAALEKNLASAGDHDARQR